MTDHHGRMSDSTDRADSAVFGSLFMVIGTVLLVNPPPTNAGLAIVCAAISYVTAAVFFFRAIVTKR